MYEWMNRRAYFRRQGLIVLLVVGFVGLPLAAPAEAANKQATAAQDSGPKISEDRCEGPVYEATELSRRAKVTSKPEPGFTEEARLNDVRGRVRLRAVLCRSGRVTNIQVIESLPYGMTEKVLEAVRRIKFTPAKKNGRAVSQWAKFEYSFNDQRRGTGVQAAGRLVEDVIIEGNRRVRDEDILYYIQTRHGDRFDEARIRRDLQSLLDLHFFDKTATCVSTTEGPLGGVVVIFTIKELPVIRDIIFGGMESVTEADVLREFRERRVGISKESAYDPVRGRAATRIIKELLAARGQPHATVDLSVENVSATSVTLTFVISEWR